jgi:hypothetical protein
MNQITKKTTSQLASIQSLNTIQRRLHEYPSNNKAFENRDISTMNCTVIFVFGDARPKNSLLISNFTICESLLLEGYLCKPLQTLYT